MLMHLVTHKCASTPPCHRRKHLRIFLGDTSKDKDGAQVPDKKAVALDASAVRILQRHSAALTAQLSKPICDGGGVFGGGGSIELFSGDIGANKRVSVRSNKGSVNVALWEYQQVGPLDLQHAVGELGKCVLPPGLI